MFVSFKYPTIVFFSKGTRTPKDKEIRRLGDNVRHLQQELTCEKKRSAAARNTAAVSSKKNSLRTIVLRRTACKAIKDSRGKHDELKELREKLRQMEEKEITLEALKRELEESNKTAATLAADLLRVKTAASRAKITASGTLRLTPQTNLGRGVL